MKRIFAVFGVLAISAGPLLAGVPLPPPNVVPEPATMALTAVGLALVGAIAVRRNKKG